MKRSEKMPASTETLPNRQSEHDVAVYVREVLASALPNDYQVQQGANLLYRIEIDGSGKVSNRGDSTPRRGRYAFQTDVLVSKAGIHLVVVELKSGSFSTHDVITYSWKAQRHKQVYPYLRYGFAVVGLEALGRRFVTHNEGFDFAVALPTPSCIQTELVAIVGRQIASAERMIALTASNRLKLRRYEEIVEID